MLGKKMIGFEEHFKSDVEQFREGIPEVRV